MRNSSIKTRISNLLFATIIFIAISGCMVVLFVFSHTIKSETLNDLNKICADFYTEAITQPTERAQTQANHFSELLSESEQATYLKSHQYKPLAQLLPTGTFAILDLQFQPIFSTISKDLPLTYLQTHDSQQGYTWLEGNSTEGIWVNALSPIQNGSQHAIGYVLIHQQLSSSEAVNHIYNNFHLDATIFYKDIRVATSIRTNNQLAIGTQLDGDIANALLIKPSVFSGNATILGAPYLTSYKSFGNLGEAPIGILFVGESLNVYTQMMSKTILIILGLGILIVAITLLFTNLWLQRNIVQPLALTTDTLSKIASASSDFDTTLKNNTHYLEFTQLNHSIIHMVAELNASKQQLEKIAYFDDLTPLPNRFNLFKTYENTHELINQVKYLLCIDLDNLKVVNDFAGHLIGDQLIIFVGKRLSDQLAGNEHCKLYRIGGDEFVICVHPAITRETLEALVKKLYKYLKTPFEYGEYSLDVSVSIGVVECTQSTDTIWSLLQNAELAMYEAKNLENGRYLFYNQTMGDKIRIRKELEEDLKYAIERNELFLMYQPKLNLETGTCDSFEALIRWNHPTKGLVSPIDFIDIAETCGLINPIGKWVLEEACRMLNHLHETYDPTLRMSVNISTLQLNRENFFRMILETLLVHALQPEHLELEITESVLIDSLSTSIEKLQQLHVLGVGISIDDFGKGYSSLAYLSKLPISTLKIDKLFIDEIEEQEDVLTKDIIKLAHHMKLKTVAEGVETAAQLKLLTDFGCDFIQGYYFSRPLKPEALFAFLDQHMNENI